ncbi:MAG: hypothetical protein MI866_05985 [Bacteroidales bacterium]|nr:hypothetical protein [Bacteroidales bacterium]
MMINLLRILLIGLLTILTSCNNQNEREANMKYTSAITFLYYEDFSYGIDFFENVLQLDLVMDQGFARVYQVNEKAYLGIVQKKDTSEVSGNTLFSLTTTNLNDEYIRVKQLQVYKLSELKHFESIPLKSFFFDDKEGHKFEIQQFLNDEDVKRF